MSTYNITLTVTEYSAKLALRTETPKEAWAIAASLPKSYLPYSSNLWCPSEEDPKRPRGHFSLEAKLQPTKGNEGFNESGVARMTKAIAKLRQLGHTVTYELRYTNSFPEQQVRDLFNY